MRALIQRVSQANVKIDGKTISEIKQGLLILVCAMADDNEIEAEQMASKISKIRIFNDENGKMNKSIKDVNGEAIDPPPQNDAGNANRLKVDDIRAVEIALTTRSRKNFYKNETTNDGSNRRVFEIDSVAVLPEDDDGTEFTDRFLRETVVLSVNTRNIGLE